MGRHPAPPVGVVPPRDCRDHHTTTPFGGTISRIGVSILRGFTLLGLLAAFLAVPPAPAEDKPGMVIQVSDNDPAKWNPALNNADKLISAMGGPDKVEVWRSKSSPTALGRLC